LWLPRDCRIGLWQDRPRFWGGSLDRSQLGDLFESAVKRRFGVKDSSLSFPGCGLWIVSTDSSPGRRGGDFRVFAEVALDGVGPRSLWFGESMSAVPLRKQQGRGICLYAP